MHTPLMLQVVLGLDAATIASAFLTSPDDDGAAVEPRESQDSRRRHRLRDPGSPASCLSGSTRSSMRSTPHTAAAGTTSPDPISARGDLAQEAVWLARTLVQLLPDEPETKGLLALMLFCEARRSARRTVERRLRPDV